MFDVLAPQRFKQEYLLILLCCRLVKTGLKMRLNKVIGIFMMGMRIIIIGAQGMIL